MKRITTILFMVAAIVVVGVSAADAGWVVTDADGEEILISKGKMRSDWENGAAIFDGNTNTIYFFDDEREIMAGATPEEICTGMEKMIENMMEGIPEEQREMMKKMQGEGKAPKVEIVEKGAGEKVAGFATTKYEVKADGELYEEVWIANDKKLLDDCKAVMKMMGKFSSCMESLGEIAGSPSPEASPEYMKIFEMGMIVKTVSHSDDSEGDDSDIIGIVQKDIADSAFAIPEGYEKVSFAEIFGMGGE